MRAETFITNGLKKRVSPHERSDSPTLPFSRTVTSKPRSRAPIAAAMPIGPAPMTATRRTRSDLAPRHRVAGLNPMRDRSAAADHRGDIHRFRHLLRRNAGVRARRGVRVDAIGLLNRKRDRKCDQLLRLFIERALLHRGRVPL